jgi:hypothetical protein
MGVHIEITAQSFVVNASNDAVQLTDDPGLAAVFETPEKALAFLAEHVPSFFRWWRGHEGNEPHFVEVDTKAGAHAHIPF